MPSNAKQCSHFGSQRSFSEEIFGDNFPVDAPFLRLLRFAKVARSLRVLKRARILGSLHLLLKSVHASVEVLFWSLCLLAIIQCALASKRESCCLRHRRNAAGAIGAGLLGGRGTGLGGASASLSLLALRGSVLESYAWSILGVPFRSLTADVS